MLFRTTAFCPLVSTCGLIVSTSRFNLSFRFVPYKISAYSSIALPANHSRPCSLTVYSSSIVMLLVIGVCRSCQM